jgi:uncharacterized RDD family membrane protein YckC
MLAWAVDFALIGGLATAVRYVLRLVAVFDRDLANALFVLTFFALSIGYGIVLEWFWRGQTLGKRILRLRVLDAQGLRLQFYQVAMRNLLRFIDGFPALYLVGGIACALSPRCQRLGDIAANTVVVRTQKVPQPNLEQVERGRYNSLLDYPNLVARLRYASSEEVAEIAVSALVRRDEFDAAERVATFREIASYFQSRVEFPSESSELLSDEQYVRNVVGALYR